MKYRRKPVVVGAIKLTEQNIEDILSTFNNLDLTYYSQYDEETEKTNVLTEVRCSKCGKLLDVHGDGIKRMHSSKNGLYYTLTTGHHLWGNDSVDSVESEEYCEDCLRGILIDWLYMSESTYYCNIKCVGTIDDFNEYTTEGLE